MNYQTLLLVDLLSLTVYAVAAAGLALKNRAMNGMGWFAWAVLIDVAETGLQALKGHVPPAFFLLANELNILAFLAMYLGYRWFVLRTPLRGWVGRSLLTGMMVLYAVLFFAKAPYNFLASVVPVLVLCWLAIRLLLKDGDKSFRTVSRVAAAILCLDIVVILYRTSLAVVGYGSQLTNAGNFNNPHLLYPILAEMLLNGFLVMTYMWFCVTEMQGALTRFAGTDALTGVLNRRALEAEAEREIARCARSGASLSLFAIDIDRFKKVNDTLGHRGGDRALVELVRVMKQELRLVDIVARIGGDEFVVLLPDATLAAAKSVAERLRIAVAQHKTPFDGGAIEMTISVGLAQLLPTDGSWQTVLDRADKALYQCKRAGRNSIAVDEGAIELLPDRVDHLQLRGNAGRVLWS